VPVEHVERALVMRDDDDALASLVCHLAEQLHHLAAPLAVERRGGFIGVSSPLQETTTRKLLSLKEWISRRAGGLIRRPA
jgi:hypothetical protein